ncbi:hypothetical protein, partial [Pandoraea communis]|uniref:hypothetical protein n=1 Tax=Pandoraea communis TaxID=2508297 RepID=UPI001C2CE669
MARSRRGPFFALFKLFSQKACQGSGFSLISRLSQRRRRSESGEADWGDGLESPVVRGFGAGELLRRRAKKAKKTVDDDEKLRHNLTSLLLMQRR